MKPEQVVDRHPVPLQWQINGLRLAGLSWGEPGEKPLLALHGWLDNAASFALLAPLLDGYHVVALDLTGHGQSGWRSADASYQIWDDLPEILGVVDALGWETFDLCGHSRGAIIAALLASTCPERVQRLVLLDAVSPQAVPAADFVVQMRTALQDKARLLSRANRTFATLDAAVDARQQPDLPRAAAQLLVERNLRACPEGVTWTTDPRLRGASAVKLTEGQSRAVLAALAMPTLLLMAQDLFARYPQIAENAQRDIEHLVVEQIAGGHHFHMEHCAGLVAQRIAHFLEDTEPHDV